jgi:alkylhydroperoxidase family enzyme
LAGSVSARTSSPAGPDDPSCEWCLDFGSSINAEAGISEEELRELPTYHRSLRFTELEKLVLDYATGMTRSPVAVPDELFYRLREHFDEAQLVELTNIIALENYRALQLGTRQQGPGVLRGRLLRPA